MDKSVGCLKDLIEQLIEHGARRATKFVSPTLVVRVTRVMYKRGPRFNNRQLDFRVCVGKPNYKERKFIKMCQKARYKFPLGRIQLQFPPK